jgi:carboxymethylenebutenolidase
MGEERIIPGRAGESFMGYLASPKDAVQNAAPGIVLIQEIFGVNQVMRDLADNLAKQGFVVLCPDLFWRMKPNVNLTDKTEEDWKQAFDYFGRFDVDAGVRDIQASIHTLRGHSYCSGHVGTLGYCLGGKLAYLAACRTKTDCSVGYYAVGLDEILDEAQAIKNPLMLHVAALDQFVPPPAQDKIIGALSSHDKVTLHHYEGVDHAFARVGGDHYDAAQAKIADQRTIDFLKENLG